jgi:hypothetical protein
VELKAVNLANPKLQSDLVVSRMGPLIEVFPQSQYRLNESCLLFWGINMAKMHFINKNLQEDEMRE